MMHDETAMQDEMKRAGESEELRFGATRTVGDVLGGKMIFNYLEIVSERAHTYDRRKYTGTFEETG